MIVEFKALDSNAKLPLRQSEDAAAYDLVCPINCRILPGGVWFIYLGFAIAIPPGFCGLILPRSGMASNRQLRPVNSPGLIDADYRGEVIVAMENFGEDVRDIKAGDRIAQLLFVPAIPMAWKIVEELSPTTRGEGGFGSTGEGSS